MKFPFSDGFFIVDDSEITLTVQEENIQYFIENRNLETFHCKNIILAVSTVGEKC